MSKSFNSEGNRMLSSAYLYRKLSPGFGEQTSNASICQLFFTRPDKFREILYRSLKSQILFDTVKIPGKMKHSPVSVLRESKLSNKGRNEKHIEESIEIIAIPLFDK